MRKTALTILLVTSVLAGQALADGLEPMTSADSRFKILNYDESDVYTITTRYGYQTNIVFADHEEIQTISVGDRSLWQIIPSGNRLFIRPMEENVITNMTVLTNKHSYQFDLKSQAAGKSEGTIYVAKFKYPDSMPKPAALPAMNVGAPAGASAPEPASMPSGSPFAMAKPTYVPPAATHIASVPEVSSEMSRLNYNYTFSGPDELAPSQVYDDGQATYIKFADLTPPLPNTYIVEAGQESPAHYHVQDGMMVVDSVAGEILLKSAGGTVKIYNEILNPQ